jgi:hypothetical protein
VLRVLRTPRRVCGRQIANADHNGYPAVDRRDRSPVPPSGAIVGYDLAYVTITDPHAWVYVFAGQPP